MLALVAVLTMAPGCSDDSSKAQMTETAPTVLRVLVLADGAILLDGAKTSLLALRERFRDVADSHAVVWYCRAQGESEAPEVAPLVIQAVIDNRLPISMSSESDFSTVVAPDGTVKPR